MPKEELTTHRLRREARSERAAERAHKANIRIANNERAARALSVLRSYERSYDRGEGVDTALVDLLADLMHWGSAKRRHSAYDKFEGALDTARGHFEAEELGVL